MKTLILFFIVSVFINENSHLPSHIFLSKKDIHVYTLIIDSIDKLNKEKERFALAIQFKETNCADTINKIGCFSRFQFKESTLRCLGYQNITLSEYRKNKNIFPYSLQKEAFFKLISANEKCLRYAIKYFEGKYIEGILITKSGILAAAHLAGVNSVIRYLYQNDDSVSDINNTKISDYMKQFSNFKI